MNLLLSALLLMFLSIMTTSNSLLSQTNQTLASPIQPERILYQGQLGLVIGLGQNFQSGKYFVDCEDCVFEDGVKFGYTIGLNYEYSIHEMINIGVMGLYDDYGLKNSYVENERLNVQSDDGSYNEFISIPFRHTAALDLTTFSIMPHIKFFPARIFFVDLGFSMAMPINSNIKHEKELLKTTARLSNGAVVDISIDGTNATKVVIEDNEFPLQNSPQFSLVPMTGFNFVINNKIFLRPFFMYRIPLNNFSDRGENFMLNSWRFMFEVSLKL